MLFPGPRTPGGPRRPTPQSQPEGLRVTKGEGRFIQRGGPLSGWGPSPPPTSLAPRAGGAAAGPCRESRGVCTHAMRLPTLAHPPLACFPSWWYTRIPLPSEIPSRAYTRAGILDMEDSCSPANARKSVPCVHTGRGHRHGLVKAERFPCWPEALLFPQSESSFRVYTRYGISGTCPNGQLAAKVYAQGHAPPARSPGHLPEKRIGAQTVGDGPQRRTATLPP